MTKSARFLAVNTIDSAEDYVKLYINEIVRLHVFLCLSSQIEVLNLTLISRNYLGTQVNLSTTFHP